MLFFLLMLFVGQERVSAVSPFVTASFNTCIKPAFYEISSLLAVNGTEGSQDQSNCLFGVNMNVSCLTFQARMTSQFFLLSRRKCEPHKPSCVEADFHIIAPLAKDGLTMLAYVDGFSPSSCNKYIYVLRKIQV